MMSETSDDPAVATSVRSVGEGEDQITLSVSTPAAGQAVIAIAGEVDMLTSPHLRSVAIEKVSGHGIDVVVLDLDAVTFLGTSGLAALIEVREAAHRTGVELRLACTARRVLRPLTIAGLIPLFDIHESVERALVPT